MVTFVRHRYEGAARSDVSERTVAKCRRLPAAEVYAVEIDAVVECGGTNRGNAAADAQSYKIAAGVE